MVRRRARFLAVSLLLAIYAAGYVAARQAHWIVHRSGYYTDADQQQRVSGHRIMHGDFGTPLLMPGFSFVQSLVVGLYLPARQAEAVAWRWLTPAGSEWPATPPSFE
jgi:hypothetical protein